MFLICAAKVHIFCKKTPHKCNLNILICFIRAFFLQKMMKCNKKALYLHQNMNTKRYIMNE